MSRAQTILAPILNPRPGGTVDFLPNGALSCDDAGSIIYIGEANSLPGSLAPSPQRCTTNLILPPFLDAHIHIPQHPIRGRFMEGIGSNPSEGRLLAGLNRNVFPAEARCADAELTDITVDAFQRDTLARGVVGGAAYMTVHPDAALIALNRLPHTWSVGLVLMNMNCPPYLRTREATLENDVRDLAHQFVRRLIVTDRFAVAVDTPLRRRGVALAKELNLRMQTHLNEQPAEKRLVERELYPSYKNYTDVYARDGLLDCDAILAHCVQMSGEEFDVIASRKCAIAHCPTSNTLLGSGVMPLDEVVSRGIPWAICTDVGASPTTSLLAEMAQFLKVHAGRSRHATPQQALFRVTLAPAQILGLDRELGSFDVGRPMSFVEVAASEEFTSADDAILRGLLDDPTIASSEDLDALAAGTLDGGPMLERLEHDVRQTAARLENKVISVTLAGKQIV